MQRGMKNQGHQCNQSTALMGEKRSRDLNIQVQNILEVQSEDHADRLELRYEREE